MKNNFPFLSNVSPIKCPPHILCLLTGLYTVLFKQYCGEELLNINITIMGTRDPGWWVLKLTMYGRGSDCSSQVNHIFWLSFVHNNLLLHFRVWSYTLGSPIKAPNTNSTQPMTQASMAVSPSALGMLVVMVLKMFTRTRKTVMRSVILENEDW